MILGVNRATLELLEKLGILRGTDTVDVLRKHMNASFRRGPSKQEPRRPVCDGDFRIARRHSSEIKRYFPEPIKTLQCRWGLNGQEPKTMQETGKALGMNRKNAERNEILGVLALHQRILMSDDRIPEDVRLWAGMVFHVLNLKPSPEKRLLARTLDSPDVWKLPGVVKKLNEACGGLLFRMIGLEDGVPKSMTELGGGRGGRLGIRTEHNYAIHSLADKMGIPPYGIDWINALEDCAIGRKGQPIERALTSEQRQTLDRVLGEMEADETLAPRVTALRMRTGLQDGHKFSCGEVERETGILKNNLSKTLRAFLFAVESKVAKVKPDGVDDGN